jgi:hypothetical protein
MRPVGAEWLHSNRQKDGRMDLTKLIIVSFYFANGRKKEQNNFLKPTYT